MVFMSCGCGGGRGGTRVVSQNDDFPGWDTPPNPVADNQNTNNGNTNQNQNQNQNSDTPTNPDNNNQNQDNNTENDTPVTISRSL